MSDQAIQFAIRGAVVMAAMLIQIPFFLWLEKLGARKKKKTTDG